MAFSSATCLAQEADSLVLSEVDDALTFEDSLSIFNLIDSLLQYGDIGGSQLAVRLSYNSNVLSAGRTLGIENFGLAPGLSYYHKSGFYADVSGFWSKDFDPSYYLTVASVGYMHSFSKYFSFMAGYDRYFYNLRSEDEYIPYKNTLSVTPIIDLKPVLFSLNYSFYFGDAYVHRIMPGMSVVLEKKKLFQIDRVAISPSFFMLMGNEILTELEWDGPSLRNKIDYGTWFRIVERNENVFGVMNYAFSLPLTITHKGLSFSFTYTYNIPKALPGEPLTISESSY
ncbi:MAG: hypothetical protein C0490_12045, partial [Marivirga sp.]|nr:hypothetical protein [Marivirga sp.]